MNIESYQTTLSMAYPFTLDVPKPYLHAYTPLHQQQYVRAIKFDEQNFVCRVTQQTPLTKSIDLTIESDETITEKAQFELILRMRYELGLDEDMSLYVKYGRKNRAYRRILNLYPGFRMMANSNLPEASVLILLSQHASFGEWIQLTKGFYQKYGTIIPWNKKLKLFPENHVLNSITKTQWKKLGAHMQAKYLENIDEDLIEQIETYTFYPVFDRGLKNLISLPGIATSTARILMVYTARRYEKAIYNQEIRKIMNSRFDREFKSAAGFDKWIRGVFPHNPAVLMHPFLLDAYQELRFDYDFFPKKI